MNKIFLIGDKIKLTRFTKSHIDDKYLSWLNNHSVTRYMDTGRMPVSIEELEDRNNHNNLFFAIESIKKSIFIGTVSANIDWISRKSEIGYMLGDVKYSSKGLGTEAVNLICEYLFGRLNMNKISAGVVSENIASMRVLEKNGFKKFSTEPEDYYLDGKYLGTHRFYKLRKV